MSSAKRTAHGRLGGEARCCHNHGKELAAPKRVASSAPWLGIPHFRKVYCPENVHIILVEYNWTGKEFLLATMQHVFSTRHR